MDAGNGEFGSVFESTPYIADDLAEDIFAPYRAAHTPEGDPNITDAFNAFGLGKTAKIEKNMSGESYEASSNEAVPVVDTAVMRPAKKVCPICQTEASSGANFCGECGHEFS